MYAYVGLADLILLYPVYALLFADTGLSPAEISSLFALWSVTSLLVEVPSGIWADMVSRRRLLALAPLLAGAGFALWTFLPCYPSFAVGFVLWGVGTALRSGSLEALVFEELARSGAQDRYAQVLGRSEAIATTACMAATALSAPVLAAGGYIAVGIASVAASVLAALVGRALPESRRSVKPERGHDRVTVLGEGLAAVRAKPAVRRCLLLVAVLSGIAAVDEYVPLLVRSTGAVTAAVPVLVLLVEAGAVVGGWCAGRGVRHVRVVLMGGAGCLAVGAAFDHWAGMALVAIAFGVFQWAMAAAQARLQEHVEDRARATLTSLAGLGSEGVAVLLFAGYALGSTWSGPGPLFVVAAFCYLAVATLARRLW